MSTFIQKTLVYLTFTIIERFYYSDSSKTKTLAPFLVSNIFSTKLAHFYNYYGLRKLYSLKSSFAYSSKENHSTFLSY